MGSVAEKKSVSPSPFLLTLINRLCHVAPWASIACALMTNTIAIGLKIKCSGVLHHLSKRNGAGDAKVWDQDLHISPSGSLA